MVVDLLSWQQLVLLTGNFIFHFILFTLTQNTFACHRVGKQRGQKPRPLVVLKDQQVGEGQSVAEKASIEG